MFKMIKGKMCRKTRYPGVWQLKEGGYWMRARAKSAKTGLLVEVNRVVQASGAAEASALLQGALDEIRKGSAQRRLPRFSEYAASLTERKIAEKAITGYNSKRNWRTGLEKYLLPFFGDMYIDQIRRADLQEFKARLVSGRIGHCRSPNSVNHWLRMLKVIVRAFVAEHELPVDPMRGFELVDTSCHRTYTKEQPNSLEPNEQAALLDLAMQHYPHYYALFVTGFALGQRPSSLTPLRRKGAEPDILWHTGEILFRQSHTRGQEVLARTKTKKDLTIEAGPDSQLFDVLRWHVETFVEPEGPMRDSDLLFPTITGKVLSQTCISHALTHLNLLLATRTLSPQQAAELDRRCRGGYDNRRTPSALREALQWAQVQGWPLASSKVISLRVMRRSFYVGCDRAQIADRTARMISGHASEAMANRYRTPGSQGGQQRQVVGQVISLLGVREQMARRTGAAGVAPPAAPLEGRRLA